MERPPYEMTEAEARQVTLLDIKIDALTERIARLQPHDAVLDAMPPTVGGSGGAVVRRRNQRRERYLDRTIDAALAIGKLEDERRQAQVERGYIMSGAAPRRAQATQKLEAYLRSLKPGDAAVDPFWGACTVERVNAKSITFRIGPDHVERRPYRFFRHLL